VTLGNPRGADAAPALEVASEGERTGAGGARLWNRLRLSVSDGSRVLYDVAVKPPPGVTVRSLVATVNGRRRAAGRTAITLRGLPRGAFRVKATATLASGRTLTRTRAYRACAAR
jgi:hypothetical protein